MEGFKFYSKEGGLAGASAGAVTGVMTGIAFPFIITSIIGQEISNVSLTFLTKSFLGFGAQGVVLGSFLGIIMALGFLEAEDIGFLNKDQGSIAKYSLGFAALFITFTGVFTYRFDSFYQTDFMPILGLMAVSNALLILLWGHWFGKKIQKRQMVLDVQ